MSPKKTKAKRKPLSEAERARRHEQRKQAQEQSLAAVETLLYSRQQTAKALGGISVATVIRMEDRGLLDKVRFAGEETGPVFHRVEQVRELARNVPPTSERA
jgi:hypothetical protein